MTALKDSPCHHQHQHPPTGAQLTQGPCPVNSLNIHEARQVCPHQDDISTSVLVSPVNAASLPVSPVDVRVQQSEAVGMLHRRQQGAAVRAIEIRSLDPLQEEAEHHPILKTLSYCSKWETVLVSDVIQVHAPSIAHTLRKPYIPLALSTTCSRASKQPPIWGYQIPNDKQC